MNKPVQLAGSLFVLAGAIPAYASGISSGADALLNTVVQTPGNTQVQVTSFLDNPVSRQLFTEWSSQKGLSYEMNAWVQSFFSGKYETFAHLKTAMGSKAEALPLSFQQAVRVAHLYSLYRMNLSQTFMNEWLAAMENSSSQNAPAFAALDEALMSGTLSSSPGFESWLLNQKIFLNPNQETLIRKIGFSRHPSWLLLNAYVMQRKGALAEEVLSKLPVNSAFRPVLSMTVALAYARKGDLANAGKTLKVYFEPWMNQSKDPLTLSRYQIEIARLLYQAGSIDGAIQYYEKIPKGSPDYLTSREELSWCWLRQGNLEQLRGNLSTLNSSVLSDQFRPESSLVKAISDLKLCNYSEVEKDFENFMKQNREWAKKIDSALAAGESLPPRQPDSFSKFMVDSIAKQSGELTELDRLSNESVSATLPAVGPQKHWTDSIRDLKLTMEATKKRQAEEYRRQWKSDQKTLQEAIRKMQFVKVELLSQVSQENSLTNQSESPTETVETAKNRIQAQGDLSFPFDGVVWPDELFKLRAVANGNCVGKRE